MRLALPFNVGVVSVFIFRLFSVRLPLAGNCHTEGCEAWFCDRSALTLAVASFAAPVVA